MDSLRQLKLIRKEAQRIADFYGNIQAGSGTTDALGDATVAFPGGFAFSAVPKVLLQGVDATARGVVLDVVSKSTTGFSVKARKVTGVDSGGGVSTIDPAVGGVAYTHSYSDPGHTHTNPSTGSGGVDHTHGYSGSGTTGGPSATASVADGYYYTSVVTGITDPGHGHTFTGSALGTHSHTSGTYYAESHSHGSPITTSGPSATVTLVGITGTQQKYAADTSGGSPTFAFWAVTSSANYTPASGTHTHTVTLTAQAPDVIGTSGAASAGTPSGTISSSATGITTATGNYGITGLHAVDVASSTHTHGFSWSGTTGGASAYSHTHAVGSTGSSTTGITLLVSYHYHTSDSPVLSCTFDYLAILPQ